MNNKLYPAICIAAILILICIPSHAETEEPSIVILGTRKAVIDFYKSKDFWGPLTGKKRDLKWLLELSLKYRVESGKNTEDAPTPSKIKPLMGRLMKRVDIVPPSLAIAQASMESGYATSRFTLEGNALFGQWT